jgi:flagellar basal-body rod protein FlgB
MQIFGPLIQGLGQALDLYQARHRLLTENVANAETPGYRARDLDFGAALTRAFEHHDDGRDAEEAEPVVDGGATIKIDGNSVDVDTEMARMSQNAEKIVALSQIISRKFAGLRAVITEGRS